MKQLLNNKYLAVACRLTLGGIFIFAGGAKLMEPTAEFIAIGRSWDIIPDPFLTWYITALPWVEVLFGALLILGIYTRISAGVIGLTLLSFIIGIVVNMIRGRTLQDCGCFGGALHFGDTFSQLLWRDLLLMAMAIILMISRQTWLSLDKLWTSTPNPFSSEEKGKTQSS